MATDNPPLDDAVEPFDVSIDRALEMVRACIKEPALAGDLERLTDGVFVRNLDRALILFNSPFRDLFPSGALAPGRASNLYLGGDLARLSEGTDELLLNGARWVELEHSVEAGDGRRLEVRVHKRLLRGDSHPPLLFGVLRRLGVSAEAEKSLDLEGAARIVRGFDAGDLRICRGICAGSTNQTLSAELGMTTRAVEMRRQKILNQLGLGHTVELVKLLVRLQDRGYLDLGI